MSWLLLFVNKFHRNLDKHNYCHPRNEFLIHRCKLTAILFLLWCLKGYLPFYSCIGGYDNVQIFSDLQPLDVARHSLRLSEERTTMLTDNSMSTCYSIYSDFRINWRWIKVLPMRSYLLGKTFSVVVAGRYASCSPIEGLSVAVQPACTLNHTCTKPAPCIVMGNPQTKNLMVCEHRCQVSGIWDFVAVYLGHVDSSSAVGLDLCEIWFTN